MHALQLLPFGTATAMMTWRIMAKAVQSVTKGMEVSVRAACT